MSSIIDMTRLSKSEETLGNGISDTRIKGYPKGYPELAAFMESDPGFGILRRFNHLHLRNLLYMQEELTSMDRRLYEIDASETDELNNMTRPGDENVDRKVLMTEIRVKLREYDDLLVAYHSIFNLKSPTKGDLQNFRRWFHAMNPLVEEEAGAFQNTKDLCSLSSQVSDFAFQETLFKGLVAKFIRSKWIEKIFKTNTEHQWDPRQIIFVSDNRIYRAMRLTTVIAASFSLLIPIIVLYFVHTSASRLVSIVLFTLAFSTSLCIFTKANSSEIFGGTAAFSAVMVVFVGTGLGSS